MLSNCTDGPVRVLIGEGRPLLQAGLARMLGERSSVIVILDPATPDASAGDASVIDVAVLDVEHPGGLCHVLEAAERLAGRTRIVLCGISDETLEVLDLLDRGVQGFLDETADIDELIEAIERVARGSIAVSPALTRRVAVSRAGPTRFSPASGQDSFQGATPREIDVLRLVAAGSSNREVARSLSVSEHTVRAHLRSLATKLNARNRMQAVHEAMRLGLLVE